MTSDRLRRLFEQTAGGVALAATAARRSFDFTGRSRRAEYVWYWFVSMLLGAMIHGIADFLLEWRQADTVFVVMQAGLEVPMFALVARRFHDIGLTGWLALPLVPAVAMGIYKDYWYRFTPPDIMISHGYPLGGWIQLLALPGVFVAFWALIHPGDPGANRYGPDPRSESEEYEPVVVS